MGREKHNPKVQAEPQWLQQQVRVVHQTIKTHLISTLIMNCKISEYLQNCRSEQPWTKYDSFLLLWQIDSLS